jgi:hypothetical protein
MSEFEQYCVCIDYQDMHIGVENLQLASIINKTCDVFVFISQYNIAIYIYDISNCQIKTHLPLKVEIVSLFFCKIHQ